MTGHLDLVCGLNSKGESHLSRQSFRAPMHISKPFLDEGVLVVNVVNPTAGLFEGDDIRCSVRVTEGARLLLTAPSASRSHRMNGAGEAALTQHFSVEHGAWLDVWPEFFIPQKGTRYRQKTIVEVEDGGGLLLCESLAPGRVASGEVFEFDYLDWETDIFFAGERVAREKYRVTPGALKPLRNSFATGYYACMFLFHPDLRPGSECWGELLALQSKSVWIGCGRLHRSGWSVKLLAGDSVQFRSTLFAARRILYKACSKVLPDTRRL